MCKKPAENGEWSREWIVVQPNYNFAQYLQIETKFMTRNKIFFIALFILAKVLAKFESLTLLF